MQLAIRKTLGTILIILLVFSPLPADFFYLSSQALAEDEPPTLEDLSITENTTWNSQTDLSLYDNISIEYGATLTIEKGTTLSFRHLFIYGNLIARGTMEEKIKLTKIPPIEYPGGEFDPVCFIDPAGNIEFNGPADTDEDPESILEFVEFSQMGGYYEFDPDKSCPGLSKTNPIRNFFFPSAYASAPAKTIPAISMNSGKVTLRNCTFESNSFQDIAVNIEYVEPNVEECLAYCDPDDEECRTECAGDVGQNRKSYLHIENSNFQNNTQNTALTSRVINKDAYDAAASEIFQTCMASHGYDYDNYWEFCNNLCTNEADNDPSLHNKTMVVLRNNWYGDASGPSGLAQGGEATGEMVYGDLVMNDFWRGSADMASNVLFLPGIKASRLYKKRSVMGNDKLWLPNSDGDIDDLKLDSDGKSINTVFTEDVIDEVVIPTLGTNIYKSFITDLESLRQKHIINNFSEYAYDWRLNVEDIAKNGTRYEEEIKSATSEIINLQKTSTSQKVTIIAHSNGGLLAKAIMQELERGNNANLIDNIILVSSPQMGTPEAIAAMLHGYDQSLPVPMTMDDEDGRELSENMPSAYGLLPSEKYFSRNQESIIDFKTDVSPYKKYKDTYGEKIDNYEEFRKFLLAKEDQREKPNKENLTDATVLNEKLFDEAKEVHQRIDAWTPSNGIKLIQIAGWGLDTIQGMEYSQKPERVCDDYEESEICEYVDVAKIEPKWTSDGDGTVTAPSSLMVEGEEIIKKFWVDLHERNKSYTNIINRKHRDILEVDQLRDFLSNIIKTHQSPETLPQYISSRKRADYTGMKPRIRMSLYSPLDIHLYDENGNHTGPITDGANTTIEENIPNTYYKIFGEQKYVGWSEDQDIRVELAGYAKGSYSVKLQEISLTEDGEENGDFTSFENLPTTAETKVKFEVPESGLKEMTALKEDYDGNGIDDYIVEPKINSSATFEGDDTNKNQEETTDEEKIEENIQKEKKEKARIGSWKTVVFTKSTDKSCQQRLNISINGRRFDDKVDVFIGNQKAKRINKKSSKKLEAIFCLDKLLKKKTGLKRTISVKNPETKRAYADKKVDLNSFLTIKKK